MPFNQPYQMQWETVAQALIKGLSLRSRARLVPPDSLLVAKNVEFPRNESPQKRQGHTGVTVGAAVGEDTPVINHRFDNISFDSFQPKNLDPNYLHGYGVLPADNIGTALEPLGSDNRISAESALQTCFGGFELNGQPRAWLGDSVMSISADKTQQTRSNRFLMPKAKSHVLEPDQTTMHTAQGAINSRVKVLCWLENNPDIALTHHLQLRVYDAASGTLLSTRTETGTGTAYSHLRVVTSGLFTYIFYLVGSDSSALVRWRRIDQDGSVTLGSLPTVIGGNHGLDAVAGATGDIHVVVTRRSTTTVYSSWYKLAESDGSVVSSNSYTDVFSVFPTSLLTLTAGKYAPAIAVHPVSGHRLLVHAIKFDTYDAVYYATVMYTSAGAATGLTLDTGLQFSAFTAAGPYRPTGDYSKETLRVSAEFQRLYDPDGALVFSVFSSAVATWVTADETVTPAIPGFRAGFVSEDRLTFMPAGTSVGKSSCVFPFAVVASRAFRVGNTPCVIIQQAGPNPDYYYDERGMELPIVSSLEDTPGRALQASAFVVESGLRPIARLNPNSSLCSYHSVCAQPGSDTKNQLVFSCVLPFRTRATAYRVERDFYGYSTVTGADRGYAGPSAAMVELDFLSRVSTANHGNSTYIAGANLWAFDGVTLHEAGHANAPEAYVTLSDPDIDIDLGTNNGRDMSKNYSYRIDALWTNEAGEEVRSPSLPFTAPDKPIYSTGILYITLTGAPIYTTTPAGSIVTSNSGKKYRTLTAISGAGGLGGVTAVVIEAVSSGPGQGVPVDDFLGATLGDITPDDYTLNNAEIVDVLGVYVPVIHIARQLSTFPKVTYLVYRTVGDGAVYYLVSSRNPETALYATDEPFTEFRDTMSDEDIVGNEIHPASTSGYIPPMAAIPCEYVAAGRERLWIFGGQLPRGQVQSSTLAYTGQVPGFSDALSIQIPAADGGITGVGFVGETTVLFRERGVWLVDSDGPDNFSRGNQWSTPRLAYGDTGTKFHESIVRCDAGLIYLSLTGFRLITPGGSVEGVGSNIDPLTPSFIPIASVVMPEKNQVRWYSHTGEAQVLDIQNFNWSFWSGLECAGAARCGTSAVLFRSEGAYWYETSGVWQDAGASIEMVIRTAWLHAGSLGDFARVRRITWFGENLSPHTAKLRVYFNERETVDEEFTIEFASTGVVIPGSGWGGGTWGAETWGSPFAAEYLDDNVWRWTYRLQRQKCSVVSFELTDQGADGPSFTATSFALEIGKRGGTDRVRNSGHNTNGGAGPNSEG